MTPIHRTHDHDQSFFAFLLHIVDKDWRSDEFDYNQIRPTVQPRKLNIDTIHCLLHNWTACYHGHIYGSVIQCYLFNFIDPSQLETGGITLDLRFSKFIKTVNLAIKNHPNSDSGHSDLKCFIFCF